MLLVCREIVRDVDECFEVDISKNAALMLLELALYMSSYTNEDVQQAISLSN